VLNIIFVPLYIVYSLVSLLVRDVAKSVYGKIVALLAAIVFLTIVAYIAHLFG
jgi:4-amino-4-deoxy-L-arabinose transferase-like glycosyltransferase